MAQESKLSRAEKKKEKNAKRLGKEESTKSLLIFLRSQYFSFAHHCLNAWNRQTVSEIPSSNKHLISPYNITTRTNLQVMRIPKTSCLVVYHNLPVRRTFMLILALKGF